MANQLISGQILPIHFLLVVIIEVPASAWRRPAKLDPNCMSKHYAVAAHRIKEAERSQDPSELLSCAGNERASIVRDGDSSLVELPIACVGLAMAHKDQHEVAAAYEGEKRGLVEIEERAICSLKQAIAEDPDDAVQWHQLGLHSLCARQFKTSQKYLKAAVAYDKNCSYAWSNLGVSLQLSEEPCQAEKVYKYALSLATTQQVHAILSNLEFPIATSYNLVLGSLLIRNFHRV